MEKQKAIYLIIFLLSQMEATYLYDYQSVMNCIGIGHPVFCIDGYVYEERCISVWFEGHTTSPVNR